MTGGSESVQLFVLKTLWNGAVLAQQVSQTTLFSDVQKFWNNFIQSGQIWALIIGIVIGYGIRNITAS
ncbi:MAG TPA: hypothetical protein IGR89_06890 [Oscillatoriaceae cyanobacterium M7585_C2015_266]|nr:hypothetical protein [Oscillatoriaceae cyanobacterium M7585_C2015_266]